MIKQLQRQLFHKTADTFHFNTIKQNQNKYTQYHKQRYIHIHKQNHTQYKQTQYIFNNIQQQIDKQ